MKHLSKLLTLVVVAAMLLCSCTVPGLGQPDASEVNVSGATVTGENQYSQSYERRTIPYSQMEYVRPDVEAIRTRCEELADQIPDAADFAAVMAIDQEMGALFEDFQTMRQLAFLRSYQDTEDTFYEEENSFFDDVTVEVSLIGNDFNRALLESQWAEEYEREVGSHSYQQIENSLLLNSASVEAYKTERLRLETDYDRFSSTYTTSYEGTEYTLTDINNLDSYNLYQMLVNQFYEEHGDEFAAMLSRMIELDKLTAHELGFQSAIEMNHLSYDRDYSTDDARQLIKNVQQYLVPILWDVWGDYDSGSMDMATTFAELPSALAQVDPELAEAWDYMIANELYDTEARATKMTSMQFCATISSYDAPFILTYWDDSFRSATTLVHEFGHFFDGYVNYDKAGSSLDAAEIYSQGLELLMYPLYDNLTPYAEMAELENLSSMLVNGLIFQSALEEFQFRIYELETFDMEILGTLYAQVMYEFGIGADPERDGPNHRWMEIGHIFTSPFYTISYVTSAAAALQIWAVSQEDWNEGVQVYLDLVHAPQNQPFNDLLVSAGLKPVHDAETMRDIAGYYEDVFDISSSGTLGRTA